MTKYKVWNLAAVLEDGTTQTFDHRLTYDAEGDCCSGWSEMDDLREYVADHIENWVLSTSKVMEVTFSHRRMKSNVEIGVVQYTLGTCTRAYGGPEEGGWWYDAFQPTKVFSVPAHYAERARELLLKYVEHSNNGRCRYDEETIALRKGSVGRTPRPHYC